MKGITVLIVCCLLSVSTLSQTKWEKADNELSEKLNNGDIIYEEYYTLSMTQAGTISDRISAYYKNKSKILNPKNEGFSIRFIPDEFKINEYGGIYRKAVLRNDSDSTLTIPRIDATIGNINGFILINDKWIPLGEYGKSTCGNSYFDETLGSYAQIEFELANDINVEGKIETKYKVTITIQGKVYESNEVTVNLYENQYKRLAE
tara:strand:- start:89 stop:703 length:615 start_codon:yes stop_codon:yes gene_type:complete